MPQDDSQQDDSPSDLHRAIVASVATMPPQPLQELGIGDGGEKLPDGAQRGAVLQTIPREQWLGHGDEHGAASLSWVRPQHIPHRIPAQVQSRSKNHENMTEFFGMPKEMRRAAGKPFFGRLETRLPQPTSAQRKRLDEPSRLRCRA